MYHCDTCKMHCSRRCIHLVYLIWCIIKINCILLTILILLINNLSLSCNATLLYAVSGVFKLVIGYEINIHYGKLPRQSKLWWAFVCYVSNGTGMSQYGAAMTSATGHGRAPSSVRTSPSSQSNNWATGSLRQQNPKARGIKPRDFEPLGASTVRTLIGAPGYDIVLHIYFLICPY